MMGWYSLITLDERVTIWIQSVCSLPRACAQVALFVRRLTITITQTHTHTMQQTLTHKAVTGRVEATNLLSCQRQSEYRYFCCGKYLLLQYASQHLTGSAIFSYFLIKRIGFICLKLKSLLKPSYLSYRAIPDKNC